MGRDRRAGGWVGQELHTHGALDLRGSSASATAQGKLALGPQDRVADIALDVDGTPERVELKQFDVSQSAGRLAARGRIDLQPQLAWDLTATAQDFDPGAFAAEWRGKLGFDLASKGRMLEKGPEATAQLTKLRGELRGRPLSGNADVSVTPPLIASGTVALNSGKSELRLPRPPRRCSGCRSVTQHRIAQRLGAELRRAAPRELHSAGQMAGARARRQRAWQRSACRQHAHRVFEREGGRRRSAQSTRLAAH